MKSRTRIKLLMVLALLLAYPLVAIAEESILQQVLKRGELIVGTRSTNLPFCYKDEKGELTGFDIDLSRELAFGLFSDRSKVKFTVFSSGGDRIPALQGRRVDCVISQFTVLEKRAQMIEFSVPYIKSGLAVLVKKDSAYKRILSILCVPQSRRRGKRCKRVLEGFRGFLYYRHNASLP